jgi:purine-nucleoside phosphorylase
VTNSYIDKLTETTECIRQRMAKTGQTIQGAVVLGSGLGAFADTLLNPLVIPYSEIPHFCPSTVSGHAGRLIIGETPEGFLIACMQGRFHYYEGHDLEAVTFPVRVLRQLGAEFLIVSNAAGGIRSHLQPGTLMLMNDHINFMGVNPLRGPHNPLFGERFPDMTTAYDPALRQMAHRVAAQQGTLLPEGIYAAVSGPCYETPAEVRMLATLGADAVGMSTVPEVIVARQAGMRVLGLSLISNQAAGLSGQPLHHTDVLMTAEQGAIRFVQLIQGVLEILAQESR